MYVYIYIRKSAWHRVRDTTSRVFAALTFARYDAERLSRGVFFASIASKKKRSVFGKRNAKDTFLLYIINSRKANK